MNCLWHYDFYVIVVLVVATVLFLMTKIDFAPRHYTYWGERH